MQANPAWHPLPAIRESVRANPRLVLQVVGGVVTLDRGVLAGHAFKRVERESPSTALVQFDLRVLGREWSTVERVTLEADEVRFTQISGYLPGVEETIRVDAAPGGTALLSYSGRYCSRPGWGARLLGPVIVPIVYWVEARRMLTGLKQLAEARQSKSVLFRKGAP